MASARSAPVSGCDPELTYRSLGHWRQLTGPEALEWVHAQMVVEDVRLDELAAAFTALSGDSPAPTVTPSEMFRRCCEIAFPSMPIRARTERATRPFRGKS